MLLRLLLLLAVVAAGLFVLYHVLPWLLLGLALVFASAPAHADCPLDLGRSTGWVIFSGHYMVAFRPDPVPVEVGAVSVDPQPV